MAGAGAVVGLDRGGSVLRVCHDRGLHRHDGATPLAPQGDVEEVLALMR